MAWYRDEQLDEGIVVNHRLRLAVKGHQPRPHGLGRIVGALIQMLSSAAAVRTRAEWIRSAMERHLTFAADHPPGKPGNQLVVRHLDVQHGVDLTAKRDHHLVERDGLLHRSREAIEHDASLRAGLADALPEHRDRDGVRHQRSASHVLAGLKAKRRLPLELVAEQVAGGDVRQAELATQVVSLRPFARSGRPEENQVHAATPLETAIVVWRCRQARP